MDQRRSPLAISGLTAAFAFIYVLVAVFGLSAREVSLAQGLASLVLATMLLALTWIDFDRFLLPDILTLPLLAMGLAWSGWFGVGLVWSLAGAVAGYGVIALLALAWRRRTGEDGMGLGDAKLLAAGGAWIGAMGLPLILLISSASALVWIAGLILAGRRMGPKSFIAFGPMLALGIWVVWCVPRLLP